MGRPSNHECAARRSGITADSLEGRVLIALRAGPMSGGEIAERWPSGHGLSKCLAGKLVEKVDGAYRLTDAGRAACPLRNPLAAKVVAPKPGALARCASSNTPATTATIPARCVAEQPKTIHPQEGLMSKLQPIADAIKAAIAGITKANAISREDLVARANLTAAPRSTLNKVFSTLTEEGDVLGAHGATVARRFYDARTERDGHQEEAERMLPRQAVTAAIAGITRDRAITKDALINAVSLICDASRPLIADMIKRMAAEATVVGAEGQTAQRRYFDIRTLQAGKAAPPAAVAQADPPVGIKSVAPAPKAEKPAASPAAATGPAPKGDFLRGVEFSIYNDGRLAIIDGDEILVLQPDDTRRLAYFLGCFDTKSAVPHLLAA